jgi:hypothetical protein
MADFKLTLLGVWSNGKYEQLAENTDKEDDIDGDDVDM